MNTWAVILAAGRGARLGGDIAKQFLPFKGKPLFWHSALTFARVPGVKGLVFVFPPQSAPAAPEIPFAASNSVLFSPSSAPAAPNLGPAEPDGHNALVPAYQKLVEELGAASLGLPWRVALGGARRQDSVAAGLAALPSACKAVLVHDSARPFASAALVASVLEALAQGHTAVIPGIAVADTIKSVDPDNLVTATPQRHNLRAVQTPQGFALAPLRKAHALALAEGWEVTDDAALIERCGLPVLVTPGEEANRKITTAADLALLCRAEAEGRAADFTNVHTQRGGNSVPSGEENEFFPTGVYSYGTRQEGKTMFDEASRQNVPLLPVTGLGYDVHRYGGERPLVLGGEPIPGGPGVFAHSDGDVLLHALIDALLGCAGGGDIGELFPDSDPAYENIASGILLAETLEFVRARGLLLTHADVTLVAQTPRLGPHKAVIAANLARLLELPRDCVNVKATTEEGLGFTGEKKGIKALAVVSALRPARPFKPGGEEA